MAFKYSSAARNDIEGILRYTISRFGPQQSRRYAELIDQAASIVGTDPMCYGSRARDEIARGVRSFHVERAAPRLGAAAHTLYCAQATLDDGTQSVIILRALHERMDPARHIVDEP